MLASKQALQAAQGGCTFLTRTHMHMCMHQLKVTLFRHQHTTLKR